MSSQVMPICQGCARLSPSTDPPLRCEAYPNGIPAPILGDRFDHRSRFAGDHGLQFVPGPNGGIVLGAVERQRALDGRVVPGAPR